MPNSEDKQTQRQKFEEAARAAECDTDEAAFEEAVKRVGNASPQTQKELQEGRKARTK